MRARAAALAAGLVLLLLAGAAFYALREQQPANREILSRLDLVRATLAEESRRAQDLAAQVTSLDERVGRLEAENLAFRRQLAELLRSRPAEVARLIVPVPIDANPLAPFAEHAVAVEEEILIEPLPITWSTDFTAFQPAGLIAPPADAVLTRKLTDPAFVRKLYIAYGALQVTDIVTTLTAVSRGAREVNPLLQDAADRPAALIGVKVAASVGTVLVLERLRRKHPVAATVTLVALNATLAVVAVNNISVVAKQQPPPR